MWVSNFFYILIFIVNLVWAEGIGLIERTDNGTMPIFTFENEMYVQNLTSFPLMQFCPQLNQTVYKPPLTRDCRLQANNVNNNLTSLKIKLFVDNGKPYEYNVNRTKMVVVKKMSCQSAFDRKTYYSYVIPSLASYQNFVENKIMPEIPKRLQPCYEFVNFVFESDVITNTNQGLMISKRFGILNKCEFEKSYCVFGEFLYFWDKNPTDQFCTHDLAGGKHFIFIDFKNSNLLNIEIKIPFFL